MSLPPRKLKTPNRRRCRQPADTQDLNFEYRTRNVEFRTMICEAGNDILHFFYEIPCSASIFTALVLTHST